jgi:hypothetical protein
MGMFAAVRRRNEGNLQVFMAELRGRVFMPGAFPVIEPDGNASEWLRRPPDFSVLTN